MSPPSIESDLETCPICGEYLANHWRRRPCLAPLATTICVRCGEDTMIEVGAGYACLSGLLVGIHEEP
jgi:ribosomal protein S27AE